MILSNVEIHRALDEKRLILEPEPSPRIAGPEGSCPFQTSSVDLRLSPEIAHFKAGLPISIDLRAGSFGDLFSANSQQFVLTEQQPFALKPGRLVLGRTLERISLPLSSDGTVSTLAARIEGKSSYARCGLLVHFTAPTIHAGFSGTITLALINLGPFDIMLYPNAPICQLILEEVRGVPIPSLSQFHGQSQAGGGR